MQTLNFKQQESIFTLGAVYLGGNRCQFRLWAPRAQQVELHLIAPQERTLPMQRGEHGYYSVLADDIAPGSRYFYCIDGNDRPDPASRFQPEGVHGPSQVVDSTFEWTDQMWTGIPLQDYIFYELHVGTFSETGTFDGIIPYLDELIDLGVTALELMPIAQFPGDRNWGYDGVYTYAPQNSYGGPDGLRRLVNACHERGLAVVLDVVYNHFGPEGNYVAEYGEYFTDAYRSAWGSSLNFDGPGSDHVRQFFIENAAYWFTEFHVDALRLDATHTIMDFSANPFMADLSRNIDSLEQQLHRSIHLIAECAKNDFRVTQVRELGGEGIDSQWNDDFHHALRTLLTCDQTGYYQDYGNIEQMVKAYREGFVFSGQYSRHMRHRFGTSSVSLPPENFVVFMENHDQIGNRAFGERLWEYLSFDELKMAAGVTLLSPYLPLIFMGQEYNETAPFLYFVSFDDPDLANAVSQGRRKEFEAFLNGKEPPIPQDVSSFQKSKLNHHLRYGGQHRLMRGFYKELIRLRKTVPALRHLSKTHMEVIAYHHEEVMYVRRWYENSEVVMVCNFNAEQITLSLPVMLSQWELCLDSSQITPELEALPQFQAAKLVHDSSLLTIPPKSFLVFAR